MTMQYSTGTTLLASGMDLNGVTVTVEYSTSRTLDHSIGFWATSAGAATYTLTYRHFWNVGASKRYSAATTLAAGGTAILAANAVAPYALALYVCDGVEVTIVGAGAATTAYELFACNGEA